MESPAVETLYESFVKPSTPTPPSLGAYKLSCYDQSAAKNYVPLVFFYPKPNQNRQVSDHSHIIRSSTESLETGLSKTLSYYYPFAGRLRDNLFIECNDMGVHFITVRIKCPMTKFLQQSNPLVKDLVFHKSFYRGFNAGDDSLVLVQLNYFDCLGMAVSICMTHKLGDGTTMTTFARDWAAMVHQPRHILSPQFIGASLFPPLDDLPSIEEFVMSGTVVPSRKLLFNAPKIALLKDMAAKSGVVKNPTRVEVVIALLYRCAVLSYMAISGSFRPAFMVLPINLRPVAALPDNTVGNLVTQFSIEAAKEDEMTLPELVSQLRNAKVNVQNEYEKAKTNGSHLLEVTKKRQKQMDQIESNKSLDLYRCSSLCRFPLNDVDFGRGKPLSVGLSNWAISENCFMLLDYGNDDSIEAIVMLSNPDHLSAFLINEELLAFASLNASIVPFITSSL